jgi:hypothetical protein
MNPTKRGIELSPNESGDLFSILATITRSKRCDDEELRALFDKASLGRTYVGFGAPDILREEQARVDNWYEKELAASIRFGRSAPDKPGQGHTKSQQEEHLLHGVRLLEEVGIVVDIDPTICTIPWELTAKVGKACLFVLQYPDNAKTWVDGSCGGFTMPGVQRQAYELTGSVAGVVAANQGFTGYGYGTPY